MSALHVIYILTDEAVEITSYQKQPGIRLFVYGLFLLFLFGWSGCARFALFLFLAALFGDLDCGNICCCLLNHLLFGDIDHGDHFVGVNRNFKR
jgi:hypothetical protein